MVAPVSVSVVNIVLLKQVHRKNFQAATFNLFDCMKIIMLLLMLLSVRLCT